MVSLRLGSMFAWKGSLFVLEGVWGCVGNTCLWSHASCLPSCLGRLLGDLTAWEVDLFVAKKSPRLKCRNVLFQKVRAIKEAVTIPVMAKCRIGHFAEAQILQSLKVDFIDESEGASWRHDNLLKQELKKSLCTPRPTAVRPSHGVGPLALAQCMPWLPV